MDILSYILGLKKGEGTIIFEGTGYMFADDGDGNITVTEDE